ncbi:MAG TPA: hypothetical protein VF163_10405 [Micromonosporaceae bacterium]
MTHKRGAAWLAVTAGLIAALATGCSRGSDQPPVSGGTTPPARPSATVSPTPTSSPSPTPPPTDPAIVFAADGIGIYVIGKSMAELSSGLTAIVESPFCADAKGAEATGRYAGQLTFTFKAGRLVSVHTNSAALVTPSGARVGMSLANLQQVYGARGTLITGTLGNKGYIVRVPASGLAIMFYLDPSNTKVAAMSGGEAQGLEDAVRHGEGC